MAGEGSTWDVIQHNIFGANCVSCHQAGTGTANQSDLLLTHDEAYDELVGELPHNTAAQDDFLKRVSDVGGASGIAQSFLWEKINAPNQEHFYEDHPNYGQIMPQGGLPLTNGELEFVKRWIFEGAPETGVVVDPAVLQDTSRYEPPVFEPLAVPESGFQLHVGPFDVWPSEVNDREFLNFQPYETTEDVFVDRYEISFKAGSHHLIVYHYPEGDPTPTPNVYRDIRDQNGNPLPPLSELGNLFPFKFFVGTQVPYVDFRMPEGVALRMPPGSGFDIDAHAVNRTDETRSGEVYVNIHTVELDEIEHVAEADNFGNYDIVLPPHEETTVSEVFTFSEQRHIFQMWAHAHEHMDWFRVEHVGGEDDGELIYWTNDWEHPVLLQTDTPLTFEEGDQIRLVTKYNNETDDEIYWGTRSTDEMQFMFYLYYTGDLTVPGDANGDGIVDAADLAVLLANWSTGDTHEEGDFNGDHTVDAEDLAILVGNHESHEHEHTPGPSTVTAAGQASPVPEPTTFTLAAIGLLSLGMIRRRRR